MAKIRARARAVDMLGRQQIATVQNAISELFKNAHDAYATHVQVDYLEAAGGTNEAIVVVRDDGIGMTRYDFENKWLVLGTESKVGSSPTVGYRPAGAAPRPITGEKGIGRLAIALLGAQVLVLTRAVREDGRHDLVACWVHWGLFEVPGLNLDEIELPVETFPDGTLPTKAQIEEIKRRLLASVEAIALAHPNLDLTRISKDIGSFSPDPGYLDSFLNRPGARSLSLIGDASGTHFIIGPANPVLKLELAAEDREQDYSFRKQLLGFCDGVFGTSERAPITTSFMRWLPGGLIGEEYLLPETFFSSDELASCSDHYLHGHVDVFGQFRGSLRVYDKEYPELVIPWSGGLGRESNCGGFRVVFGYLQGSRKESRIEPAAWENMNKKLDSLGGLYVYRDRIRILPYGDHSFDFLEVEKRRNKGAGHYFFSFRRMFGAVLLTKTANPALAEKAGREGFQANPAYRDLKAILVNLLVQLAAEFFRKGGTHTEAFEQSQTDSRRRAEALERQQKKATERRRQFGDKLEQFAECVALHKPESQVEELRARTVSRLVAAAATADHEVASEALLRAEEEGAAGVAAIRKEYEHRRPAGVALPKTLVEQWDRYSEEFARLETEVFRPFATTIAAKLSEVAGQAHVHVDQRRRLEAHIRAIAATHSNSLETAARLAERTAKEAGEAVAAITDRARVELAHATRKIQAAMNSAALQSMKSEEVEALREAWEGELRTVETKHSSGLLAARDMLGNIAEGIRGTDGAGPAEIMEALEDRMLALEDQGDQDFEMVQLGLAVAIINHEFGAAIKQVRRSIQGLGQLSLRAPGLRSTYESLRSSFDHLDGHLNLFTPLQRRLHRKAALVTGRRILTYVQDLFSVRVEEHNIALECTESFLGAQVECFPSTLYPALINVMDNAIYWVSSSSGDRRILLDATPGTLIVANSGPPIEQRDHARILERGFSRKPGGRGLGLFISARALADERMGLVVGTPPPGFGASFHFLVPNLRFVP